MKRRAFITLLGGAAAWPLMAPMLGDYASCGSWFLYSATGNIPMALSEAIIAAYMTIHMARENRRIRLLGIVRTR